MNQIDQRAHLLERKVQIPYQIHQHQSPQDSQGQVLKARFPRPDFHTPDFPSHYNPNLIVLNSSKEAIGGKEEMMGSQATKMRMVGSAFSIKIIS